MFMNAITKPGDRSAWWDGDGKYNVQGAQTPAQALKRAGSFGVEKRPILVSIGGKHVPVAEYVATVRADTKAILGIVNAGYPVMQNAEVVDFGFAVIGEGKRSGRRKRPRVLSLGALGTGAKWFMTIALDQIDLAIKRDESKHEANMCLAWGHDGLTAVRASLWDNRIVCQNTDNAAAAYGDRTGNIIRIVHAGDLTAKVAEAQRVLGFMEREIKKHVAIMNALVDVPITSPAKFLARFGEILIPIPPEMERTAGREEARNVIAELALHSKTLTTMPMSAYRVYQAVTEYADHYRPVRVKDPALLADRRASLAMGAAGDLKADALQILRRAFLEKNATGILVPAGSAN
jgi:phage/plasmid-like protein (TIGR03299 family)